MTSEPRPAVIYPESDGRPMAETEIHRDEMIRAIQTLQDAFRDTDIYVSGNLLLYYEEGNPRASVSPDVFAVKGVPKSARRRTYLLWREGRAPCTVFEITSDSTRREDLIRKRALYARLGVREYFLYDPLGDYLRPPLQGFLLVGDTYEPMAPAADGSLVNNELGLRLQLVDGQLRFFNLNTGELLLSPPERAQIAAARAEAEAARAEVEAARAEAEAALAEAEAARAAAEAARAEAEAARAEAEAQARAQAEARNAELEARLRRLEGREG